MAKKNNPVQQVQQAARNNNDDKDFENHLNRILKSYKNQGNLLKQINALQKNSNILSQSLNSKQQKILKTTLNRFKGEEKIKKTLIDSSSLYNGIMGILRKTYLYLSQNDDAIKSSALSLGLSRNLSDQFRHNLIESSKFAARLGMSVGQMTRAQEAFTAETGQSLLLSNESLKSITLIAKGTNLGAEGAGKLVGQFRLLGLNAKNTEKFVSKTLKETGKLGLNLNSVLNNISSNFKIIQSFNFSNGINGVQKMAMYADMYKINMQNAFTSIDKARTLEGAVEMSAKLMVMGGEFAKQNMFELGFLARNKPAEFTKKLNEMTKGTFFFNKELGEFQSSAFDLDRLRAVAEATGVPFQDLTEQARRLAQINLAKSQLIGFSSEDQDFLANMAEMTNKGKFQIDLRGDLIDLNNITTKQLNLLKAQSDDSLKQRALDAMTFDKEFTATIEEFKTFLLPALKSFNDALRWFQEISSGFRLALIGGGVALVTGIVKLTGSALSAVFNSFLIKLQGVLTKSSIGGDVTTTGGGNVGKGGGALGKLGGAAGGALAVGGAFLAASYGIKMIAESFKELNPEQLNAITTAIVTMGISIPVSLAAVALVSKIAAPGLTILALTFGAVGLAALGVGKGIEFATNGLSNMFSILTPDIAESISKIGWSIGKIGLSLIPFGTGLALAGIIGFTGFLASLSLNKGNIERLTNLATAMSSSVQGFKEFSKAIDKVTVSNNDSMIKELRALVSDLNNMKVSNPFSDLKELLSKPLQVEFADKNVSMVVNLSNTIDGKILAKNIYPHLAKLIRSNNENK